MRTLLATSFSLIFVVGFVAGGHWQTPVGAQGFSVTMDCGASSAPQTRTTLYFDASTITQSIPRQQSANPNHRHVTGRISGSAKFGASLS